MRVILLLLLRTPRFREVKPLPMVTQQGGAELGAESSEFGHQWLGKLRETAGF